MASTAAAAPVQLESYRATDLLRGSTNYRTWKFSVRMTLLVRDLWDAVAQGKPEEDAPADWDQRAAKALAVIALSLSAAEQQHIIDCKTPKEAWDILEKLYEGKGWNRKFMLLQELFQVKMLEGSMDEYLLFCKGKDVRIGSDWNETGYGCQACDYRQRSLGNISISGCQFGAAGSGGL